VRVTERFARALRAFRSPAEPQQVTVNVSAGGGTGTLDPTPAQIKSVIEQVPAAFRRQAARNGRAGSM
jgi:hypothetical protein